jgi:hypothetical protein
MKKIILIMSVAICFAACDNNNSLHQAYIDAGETFYTGKVDSLKSFSGNEKVKFTWVINSDPRITNIMFKWNEEKDSAVVAVNRTHSGVFAMEAILNVAEGIYSFDVYSKDAAGHRSLSIERTVQIYGQRYISFLRNRRLSFSVNDSDVTIDWKDIETPLIQYTTVSYSDYSDTSAPVIKNVRVENDEMQTVLTGLRTGDTFSVVTTYLPNNALETLDTLPEVYTVN